MQVVGQDTENPRVGGSIPPLRTVFGWIVVYRFACIYWIAPILPRFFHARSGGKGTGDGSGKLPMSELAVNRVKHLGVRVPMTPAAAPRGIPRSSIQ